MLSACGFADSHAYLPGFLRVKDTETPAEPPPDVRRMVRENLNMIFTSTSYPRAVPASPPLHDPRGLDWIACVRAELTNAVGKPLGVETYRITINGGVIIDRRRVEAEDTCKFESYQSL